MKLPPKDFTYLWNEDTPEEERHRLMPYLVECQILHIWQVKQSAMRAHKRHMRELDDWMNNLMDSHRRHSRNSTKGR